MEYDSSGEWGVANKDVEKADMLAKVLVEVHSSGNRRGERGRQKTSVGNKELLEREEERDDAINSPFTLEELKRSICKSGLTALEKDIICYTMLDHMSDVAIDVI